VDIPSLPENLSGPGLFQSAGALAALQIASRIPPGTLAKVGKAVNAVSALASFITGDAAFFDAKMPLLGGLSPNEARRIYQQMSSVPYARKNFFYIEVAQSSSSSNSPGPFNLLAIDVSYTPFNLNGESRRVGAATIDKVEVNERADLRISTFDDEYGSLKRWFREIARRAGNNADGTCQVPSSYALDFYVYHAVNDGYNSDGTAVTQPYYEALRMRPAGLELELSRREAAMQELQMTFAQMDTFMVPKNGQR
jgi:hypothetical protein